jgi:hypothetical protein
LKTVRKVCKKTMGLLIAQVVGIWLGFFYIMYTVRYLGGERFGVLSFALAFTGIFSFFISNIFYLNRFGIAKKEVCNANENAIISRITQRKFRELCIKKAKEFKFDGIKIGREEYLIY